jgi:hypothetical protein
MALQSHTHLLWSLTKSLFTSKKAPLPLGSDSLFSQIAHIEEMPTSLLERLIGVTSEVTEKEKLNKAFLYLNKRRERLGLKALKYSLNRKQLLALYREGYAAVSQIEKQDRLRFWSTLPGGMNYISKHQVEQLSPRKVELLFKGWLKVFGVGIIEVNLNGVKLKFIPPEISLLKDLEKLSLSGNQLKGLPIELSNLSKLHSLNLNGNPILANRLAHV